jgi:hypothetical protein
MSSCSALVKDFVVMKFFSAFVAVLALGSLLMMHSLIRVCVVPPRLVLSRIAVDMAQGYRYWSSRHLPNAIS